jgi:hypothetical protein
MAFPPAFLGEHKLVDGKRVEELVGDDEGDELFGPGNVLKPSEPLPLRSATPYSYSLTK